jgi:thiamine biosynthesis lipoprotein
MQMESPATAERRFHAMGTDAHVIVVDAPPDALDLAEARIEDLERRWSRFRADSEVSTLNRLAGTPVLVSGETALLVDRAVSAWLLTDGAFDPTVLGDVVRAGYDRTFEAIGTEAGAAPVVDAAAAQRGCGGIDVAGRTVRLPAGSGFDPGGIGKGLAADLVAAELLAAGAAGACVNLGGDLRVAGTPPDGRAWLVAVEPPEAAATQPLAHIALASGAVATSTTERRTWIAGGEHRHHVVDPRTGNPAVLAIVQATVIAREGWAAEALATATLLSSAGAVFDHVGAAGAEALVVDRDGAMWHTQGFGAFAAAVAA